MEQRKRDLPDFENPPAVETLMGIHYAPLEKWSPLLHFGAFWDRVKSEYPKAEFHPAIGGDFRLRVDFDARQLSPSIDFPMRCWYFSSDQNRLIQIQNGLFIQNWRKMATTDPYLHYEELRPGFEREWLRFQSFLGQEQIGTPRVLLCEVTYVNHIERAVAWRSFADFGHVFPSWTGKTSESRLPAPELVALNVSYPIENSGHLNIMVEPAVRQSDGKEVIKMTVAARCTPGGSDISALLAALDLSRRWVVLGFTDFTTPEMHKLWRRKL